MYRKLSLLFILAAFQFAVLHAQMNDASVAGQITLPDNSQLNGSIKDNIRKKGEVIIEVNGKKNKYKAGEISSVQLGNRKFVSINYTFFEVLSTGTRGNVLRKANEPSEVQYNGNEAIVISSEGRVDDLFIQPANGSSLLLITRKNANEVLSGICASRPSSEITNFDAAYVQNELNNCK